MSAEVLLRVQDLHLRLGLVQVLEGLTFDVIDRVRPDTTTGQIVGLLGPSGVGKTRLLRIIAGLDAPDRGHVEGPGGLPLAAGTVGVVFQNYPLLRHRSVLANLQLAGTIGGLGQDAAQERAVGLLRRFGLLPWAAHYPAQLSGGQRQRAAIAQQLMRTRRFLLMDEPFSGLDPAALDEVMALIIEVAHLHEHNTVLIVTHDVRAALAVCDTVLALGRDRDAEGRVASGAKLQASYDLVERGLAWQKDVQELPAFVELARELRGLFNRL